MHFAVSFALFTICSAVPGNIVKILEEINPHSDYDVRQICEEVEEMKYLDPILREIDSELSPLSKFETRKLQYKVDRCCQKYSKYETKQCLKTLRGIVLDTKCDSDVTDSCCGISSAEQRFTCFSKNPFNSIKMLVEAENEGKYSTLDFDTETRRDIYEQGRTVDENEELETDENYRIISTDFEIDSEEERVLDRFSLIKCSNSNECRRKLERATEISARKACTKNILKNGRQILETCCEAGTLVGGAVGRKNKQVCVPALFKFQTKTVGCGINHKPQCKRAFVECCKQSVETVRQGDTFGMRKTDEIEVAAELGRFY